MLIQFDAFTNFYFQQKGTIDKNADLQTQFFSIENEITRYNDPRKKSSVVSTFDVWDINMINWGWDELGIKTNCCVPSRTVSHFVSSVFPTLQILTQPL